jgi:hypothetical protein
VRLLDGATAIVAGLGLLLEIVGGPRFVIGGVTVSMASGTRPLMLAASLALVRYLLFRRDPLHRRLLRAYRRRPRTTFTDIILPAFLTTRIAVLLIGYLAVRTIGFAPGGPAPVGATTDGLGNLMSRWDANWYYQIAEAGYRFNPAEQAQQNVAFFPAYPLSMRLVGKLLGQRLEMAGLIVSLGCFLGALIYLFRLARQFMDEDHAAAAIVLLACYPFAVFYSAVYTESLFLLAAVGAFYHLAGGQSARAAAWGVLVGLARPNGFLVSVPLLVLAIQPLLAARMPPSWRWLCVGRDSVLRPAQANRSFDTAWRLAAAAMPVVGLLVYAGYLYSLTGDPLIWARAQAAWGWNYRGLAGVMSGPFRQLIEFGFLTSIRTMPAETLNVLAAVLSIAAIWPVVRRFGLASGLFVAVNLAVPLMAGRALVVGRMTSVLFPVFLWLGAAVGARYRPLWVFAFGSTQALVAVLFFTWRQLF